MRQGCSAAGTEGSTHPNASLRGARHCRPRPRQKVGLPGIRARFAARPEPWSSARPQCLLVDAAPTLNHPGPGATPGQAESELRIWRERPKSQILPPSHGKDATVEPLQAGPRQRLLRRLRGASGPLGF